MEANGTDAVLCCWLSWPRGMAREAEMATEAGFMPFEFVAEDGSLMGFDMDLMKAIADKLDMELTIDNISWDGLIPALQNGNYDAIMAGITITPERAQSVAFSEPYFESVLTIVVRSNNNDITDLDSLKGNCGGPDQHYR